MDIIYKNETKLDEDNNFSMDLISNNEIQNMIFREYDVWLVSSLGLKVKKFEDSDEYKEVKKVSDLINKIKADQKNNIAHGSIHTKLSNFTSFDHNDLVCYNLLDNRTFEYYNVETKKMDVINFPDYKKWYKENKEFEIQEHTEMHNLSYIILIMITHTYL